MEVNVPDKLYRYQPPSSYAFQCLKNGTLWFSKPSCFNDPFDCVVSDKVRNISGDEVVRQLQHIRCKDKALAEIIDIKFLDHDGRIKREFLSCLSAIYNSQQQLLQDHLHKMGVCCFSESENNLLLWSYYADMHKGFCLEYDTSFAPIESWVKVKYTDDVPVYDPMILLKENNNDFPFLNDVIANKSVCWEKEKEWRLFSEQGNIEQSIERQYLTGIYLGCRMSQIEIDNICSLFQGSDTKIYIMERDLKNFKLKYPYREAKYPLDKLTRVW